MDLLLESYAKCDETDASEELLQKLVGVVRPVIESVVQRRLVFCTSAEFQDRDDVCGEVVVGLICRLRAFRDGESTIPIESVSSYAATAAHHACDEYLRRKYPQRRRLKTKLRYVLNTEPQFAVWENVTGQNRAWLCGLKAWQLQGNEPARRLSAGRQDISIRATDRSRRSVVAMLATIFDTVQSPILLDELVSIVARLWGVSDRLETIDPEKSNSSLVPDPESHLVQRSSLERLWHEIRDLPIPQRVALLLNLRSGEGDSPIVILPFMGIASIRQIAEVLNIPAEEFAELWNKLPVDDQMIAGRLAITRQQVINLRKSARERLRRRIASQNAATDFVE
ncbi:MAG TPA: hypothetical protein VK738_15005 [Terriglobales bacterium]|nr:hypothetical protein [Terriglobales bacterium]